MPVSLDDEELSFLSAKLKSGQYGGADIMRAWRAVDELRQVREGIAWAHERATDGNMSVHEGTGTHSAPRQLAVGIPV